MARFGRFMLAPRRAPGAGCGPRAARRRGAVRREQVFWGWGEPGAGPSLPEHALPFLREALGVDGAVVSRRSRSRPCGCASRRSTAQCARGSRRSSAPSSCAATARRACCAAAASRTSTCSPSAQGDARTRRTRWSHPASHDAGGGRARRVRRGRSGGGPVRRRHERGRRPRAAARRASRRSSRSTSGGWTACSTSTSGRSPPRSARACACRRPTARWPPTGSRSATSRRATSGRRSAAASPRARRARHRPASAGSTRTSSACGWRRRPASSPPRTLPASAAGPDLRAAGGGLRGRARGHHGGHAAGAPRCRAARRYEGWVIAGFEAGLRGAARAGAGRRRPGRRAAVGRGRDPDRARLRRIGAAAVRAAVRGPRAAARPAHRASDGGRAPPGGGGAGGSGRPGLAVSARAPGRAWAASRFAGPHLRDDLLDRGVMVETLETAAPWSRLAAIHARGAGGAAGDAGRLPRLAPLSDRRLAVLHGLRPRRRRRPRRSVAGREGRGDGRAPRRRRDPDPPPRGRPRPRAVDVGGGRRARGRPAPRREGPLRPRGDHEPRQALGAHVDCGWVGRLGANRRANYRGLPPETDANRG